MSEESVVQEEAHPRDGSVEDARRAVEQTRTRISATLDALEDRLGAKRQELKERVNVLRPLRGTIRERPLVALGVSLGAGLLLGLLTGRRRTRRLEILDEQERAARRAWRRLRRRHSADLRRHEALGPLASAMSGAVRDGLAERIRRQGLARRRQAPPRQPD